METSMTIASSAPSITADAGDEQRFDDIAEDAVNEINPAGEERRRHVKQVIIRALTAAKPSAAPTAEALEERCKTCGGSDFVYVGAIEVCAHCYKRAGKAIDAAALAAEALEEVADKVTATLSPTQARETWAYYNRKVILAALKQVAHAAGKEQHDSTDDSGNNRGNLHRDIRNLPASDGGHRVAIAHPAGKEKMREALELAGSLRDCGCTDTSFLYGCTHVERRLKAVLAALSSETPQRDEQQGSGRETLQSADGRTSQSDVTSIGDEIVYADGNAPFFGLLLRRRAANE